MVKPTKKQIANASLIEEEWMNRMDVRLFNLGDELAVKHYQLLYRNHKEVLNVVPRVENRIRYISNVFFLLCYHVEPIIRYMDSVSDRRIPSVPIDKKIKKVFYNYFQHPKNGWQRITHSAGDNKYQYTEWDDLDRDFREKLKSFYNDIVSITTWYILAATGGYIDKRAAEQMEWIKE